MFWKLQHIDPNHTAIIDEDGLAHSYEELNQSAELIAARLASPQKKLIFLFCDNTYRSIVYYLAALRTGHATLLLDKTINDELKERLVRLYCPEYYLNPPVPPAASECYPIDTQYSYFAARSTNGVGLIKDDTAILLSTSGTTGSPKLVRLSYGNIQANAVSISQYLSLTKDDRPILSLPMHYSFGLSVINSHLLVGATLVCTGHSIVKREFWNCFNKERCTSFAGVPYHYQMLQRLRFHTFTTPSLRMMTQAGGRLNEDTKRYFAGIAAQKNFSFFVMYGQTEATARISYVPYERLAEKMGSIGIAIPNGSLHLDSHGFEKVDGVQHGEIVYTGPNVMMGYAEERACLGKGDELAGRLRTGDIGFMDEEGYFYISGRLKRFIKVFGLRINLDEVEKMIEKHFRCQSICQDSDEVIHVIVEKNDEAKKDSIRTFIAGLYGIHQTAVKVTAIDKLFFTETGKKDYKKTREAVANECR